MAKKYYDESWDFRMADTKLYTHCFHPYPAMMIPQVTGRLIDKYGQKANLLFDPFCGTGTSIVEASLRGINSIGTDLNPLAILIAKAKVTKVDFKKLDMLIRDFNNLMLNLRFKNYIDSRSIIPIFDNINYWFDKSVQKDLSVIKHFIDEIDCKNIADFFRVAFSETIRECSWTRNSEFKLYRMTEKQRNNFHPDVFDIMVKKLYRNRIGLKSFFENKRECSVCEIYDFNTVNEVPTNILQYESVDIVVTSPPYGDSRTTVAYGQYSRLSSQWLGFKNVNQVDNLLMGGTKKTRKIEFDSDLMNELISEISAKDNIRANDIISFYNDYFKSISNVAKIVKKGGYVCFVVGNRKVKGMVLPTDEITKQFFENNHFKHVETIIRNIPNKRMPSKNSPTNIEGVTDNTMTNEYIVILKKVKSHGL